MNEFALLYYVKAFYIPVSEMLSETGKDWYDKELILRIGKAIFEHFPEIEDNPYIVQDKSEQAQQILNELLKIKNQSVEALKEQ